MPETILSMTTVPARLAGALPKTLRVLSQIGCDIHLNIPAICASTNEKYIIPDELRQIKNVKIFENIVDLGPKTKIIPTLQRIKDPDTVIITVDDDIIYNKNLVSYHLKKRAKYPFAALGFSGTWQGRLVQTPTSDVEVDILDNYKSASYTRGMFDDNFFNFYADKSWNDDLVVSAYFRDKNVKKIVLAYDEETFFLPRLKSFPLVTLIDCPMTGCDIFRGHANKTDSVTLQAEYEAIRV